MEDDIKICRCECHREGRTVMHFAACCRHTYEKYLTKDGEIIPQKVHEVLRINFLSDMEFK